MNEEAELKEIFKKKLTEEFNNKYSEMIKEKEKLMRETFANVKKIYNKVNL